MQSADSHGVTGRWANPPGGWEHVLSIAEREPSLADTLAQYRRTRHPACLNAIMLNGSIDIQQAWWTAPDTEADPLRLAAKV